MRYGTNQKLFTNDAVYPVGAKSWKTGRFIFLVRVKTITITRMTRDSFLKEDNWVKGLILSCFNKIKIKSIIHREYTIVKSKF